MTVLEASIPEESPSEGTPYEWLPTTQIGGDTVYGARGSVMSGRRAPPGTIVLASETHNFKVRSGDGLLLRVD
jgi:hypothetical protein